MGKPGHSLALSHLATCLLWIFWPLHGYGKLNTEYRPGWGHTEAQRYWLMCFPDFKVLGQEGVGGLGDSIHCFSSCLSLSTYIQESPKLVLTWLGKDVFLKLVIMWHSKLQLSSMEAALEINDHCPSRMQHGFVNLLILVPQANI